MPDARVVLIRPECPWCWSYYKQVQAEVEVETLGGAVASLCDACADKIGTGPRRPLVDVAHDWPLLSAAEAAAYLGGAAEWRFARSVPDQPHEYLLLHRAADPLTHLRTVRFIREVGEFRSWTPPGTRTRLWCAYWTPPGSQLEYWTQPKLLEQILNRAAADRAPARQSAASASRASPRCTGVGAGSGPVDVLWRVARDSRDAADAVPEPGGP